MCIKTICWWCLSGLLSMDYSTFSKVSKRLENRTVRGLLKPDDLQASCSSCDSINGVKAPSSIQKHTLYASFFTSPITIFVKPANCPFSPQVRLWGRTGNKALPDLNKVCGRPPQYAPAPLWPFDLESGVQVKCDVGYLCANFSLPVLDLGPMYATNRHTSDSIIT